MKKRYESKVKPDKCPKCGAPVYRILYGMPVMSEEEYFNTYNEYVIYGGLKSLMIIHSEEEQESLSKAFGANSPYFEADELSSEILEAYKKHLKRINN